MFATRITAIAKLCCAALLVAGCSNNSNSQNNTSTGGAVATGGTNASGGASSTGGSNEAGGGSDVGGATSNGGTNATGGSGQCAVNARQCTSAGIPQLCSSSGTWQNDTACTPQQYCSNGNCTPCGGAGGPAMYAMPEGYCIDSTEVTRAQYLTWLNTNPPTSGQSSSCTWNTSFTPADSDWPPTANQDFPVRVNWCDAYTYCQAVGKRLCGKIGGGTNAYTDFASASADQWFNACSAHARNTYPYGQVYNKTNCNGVDLAANNTVAVGSLSNCQSTVAGYGNVFDMSGNVQEWEDCCDESSASTPDGVYCRVRGGSYFSSSGNLTCNFDSYDYRGYTALDVGFRCCSQ